MRTLIDESGPPPFSSCPLSSPGFRPLLLPPGARLLAFNDGVDGAAVVGSDGTDTFSLHEEDELPIILMYHSLVRC